MKKLLLSAICLLCAHLFAPVLAQEKSISLPAGFRALNYTSQLPEKLFYTKSVVFVNTPAQSEKNSWKDLAQQAHSTFREAGVDAVAYYFFDDVRAGRDASRQLSEELTKREVQNIIVISQRDRGFTLLITPFNGETSFASNGQEAYKQEARGSDQLFLEFEKAAYRSGLEVQNHLINDQPEFFVGAGNVIRGKRFEAFAQDLKLDKLAVPKFQEADIVQDGFNQDENVAQQIEQHNQNLENVMAEYPYEYDLVDPTIEEDKLRQNGYQYILLKLHTTKDHIQDMLGYKAQLDNKAKVGQQLDSIQTPVYKYYVKHIYTGDVYLGNVWDANKNWSDALSDYIRNMKDSLNIGN